MMQADLNALLLNPMYAMDLQVQAQAHAAKRQRTDALSMFATSALQTAHLKMLITNMVAGTLTGRGGQAITEVEQSTQTKLKLSKQGHHYPGTSERICLCTGSVAGVSQALQRILLVIKDVADSGKDPAAGTNGRLIARLVLPNSAATSIIGPGGSMINSLTERSGAILQFCDKGHASVPNQRVLTATGTFEQVGMVYLEIVTWVQADPHLEGIMVHDGGAGTSISTVPRSVTDHSAGSSIAPQSAANPAAVMAAQVEIAFDVSDMLAGTIVGKGGQFIQLVTQQTKTNVQLSPKAQPPVGLVEGMRRVVITGQLASVQAAHIMLVSRMLEKPPPEFNGPWGSAPGGAS
eukprot:TRINITY_DN75994_c0_g1_i1.p1 TRINITY_DN75994_c0_g1~~TRINITY_DN75994_c0_g1_i1.p1  ORF type:complete len:349 (-),score=56.75 TRINITY_DN75994_c0_g1_i1:107-1153(-)